MLLTPASVLGRAEHTHFSALKPAPSPSGDKPPHIVFALIDGERRPSTPAWLRQLWPPER